MERIRAKYYFSLMKLVLKSILVCPNCGFKKEEIMPTNFCQYFYKCDSCEYILKPKYEIAHVL